MSDPSETALPDGGEVEVPLSDWESVQDHLRIRGADGLAYESRRP